MQVLTFAGQNQATIESLLDWFNVKDYGVVGDDTADDTAAIQKALTAGAGRVVFFPKGTYKITGALLIPAGTTVEGFGATLDAVGNFRPLSVIGTQAAPITGVHVRNFIVNCSAGGANGSGLSFQYAQDCTWANITVTTPALNGIELLHCQRVHGQYGDVLSAGSFGIFYYDSDHCTDRGCYVYQPTSFGHEIKSCQHVVSYDLTMIEPQQQYGLYLWSGYDGVTPGPQINQYCGYVRPYVQGAATSKHLCYINASRHCFVESPTLIQVAGGWTPLEVSGEGTAYDSDGITVVTVFPEGTRITNPRIICAGNTQGIQLAGTAANPLGGCVIDGGRITGGGDRPLYFDYVADGSVRDLWLESPASDAVVAYHTSRIRLDHVRITNGTANGIVANTGAVIQCDACDVDTVTNAGADSDATSRVIWRGGRIRRATASPFVLAGSDNYVGDGLVIVDARYGAAGFDGAIRLSGSRTIVDGVRFEGDVTKVDSWIKEAAGATDNRIGPNNVYAVAVGNNVVLAAGSGSSLHTRRLTGRIDWDPPSLASGATQSTILNVTGAKVGDYVEVGFTQLLNGTRIWGEVTANDQVTVYQINNTGGAVDVASGTVYAVVHPKFA